MPISYSGGEIMTQFRFLVAALACVLILISGCTSSTSQTSPTRLESQPAASSEDHEYSVQIEGSEMKKLTVRQVAKMWEIDAQVLLDKIAAKFNLKKTYSLDSTLDDLRGEYKFSPAMIKEITESIKKGI
jgi:hypothetical protein